MGIGLIRGKTPDKIPDKVLEKIRGEPVAARLMTSFGDRDRICTCATTTVGHPLQRERVNYSATRPKVAP